MKITEYIISKLQASVIVLVIIKKRLNCALFFGKKHQYFNFFSYYFGSLTIYARRPSIYSRPESRAY